MTALRNGNREEILDGLTVAIDSLTLGKASFTSDRFAPDQAMDITKELLFILKAAHEQVSRSPHVIGLRINHACELADRILGVRP